MQIFSADRIHEWDQFTIRHEPISSINLMERAARACYDWLMANGYRNRSFTIYCGKGNNGGDGLAIARMLSDSGHTVTVYIPEFGHKGTDDFQINLAALHGKPASIRFIPSGENIYAVPEKDVIIDAIFGSGLNRSPEGLNAQIIQHINRSGCEVISIDIPSGVAADQSSVNHDFVKASHTLTFQQFKLAFLMPENEAACGKIVVLPIGLHPSFAEQTDSGIQLTDHALMKRYYKPRRDFAHKGSFGHALIVAGSYGKMGAALLATTACLRSGVGLCTIHVPQCGYSIMQAGAPEAMTVTDHSDKLISAVDIEPGKFAAIGVGPGLGKAPETAAAFAQILDNFDGGLVIDADALNLLAENPEIQKRLPADTILTPHPKEFERLFGKAANDFDRMNLARLKAKELGVVIVLKGHHTLIATPSLTFFNNTGNAGMATGGTGDTLTGIITGLRAQQYTAEAAAVLGVYLHGLAGDLAAKEMGKEALIASDLINYLGKAFLTLC
jgi:ADP-dependent NAD(P)H-hydrate dehydratase / NAD(P)H-hydrate epimerase